MSGIAAILNFDGRPADENLLRRMTDATAHRGPDHGGYWVSGMLGLGHRSLYTAPHTPQEPQPWHNEDGSVGIVMDGRVDNRDELTQELAARGVDLRNSSDAELVLRAYEYFLDEAPAKIVGDFALVVWDGGRRRLLCARDPMGIRPLCYYKDEHKFLCASEIHQLFEDRSVAREPNEAMLAEHLTGEPVSLCETQFRRIQRLEPAHLLVVERGELRKRQYFDLGPREPIRYRSDDQYVDHFSQLLRESVRRRLRGNGAVAAHLSGGLDSSSVVGMVQKLRSIGAVDLPVFETFSLDFAARESDERSYANDVRAHVAVVIASLRRDRHSRRRLRGRSSQLWRNSAPSELLDAGRPPSAGSGSRLSGLPDRTRRRSLARRHYHVLRRIAA